jgi:ribosomal protein S18 acetylase RimI-like enzyme
MYLLRPITVRSCSVYLKSFSVARHIITRRHIITHHAVPHCCLHHTGSFYMNYLHQWPESFVVAESPSGSLMGYVIGKAEGEDKLWHGHVSALTVAPEYRRLGLAKTLMDYFEDVSTNVYNVYFVDLFVRQSNHLGTFRSLLFVRFGKNIGRGRAN